MVGVIIAAIVVVSLAALGYMYFKHHHNVPNPDYKHPRFKPNHRQWSDEEVTFTWIGHSTVLINLYGTKILTDPVFGERVGVHLGGNWQIGPKRITAPALSIEEIGHVDLILLSHAHLDHFDMPTLKKLAGPGTRVITAQGIGHLLKRLPFREVREIPLGQEIHTQQGVSVRSVPVRHWGNRFPWNVTYGFTGFLIEKNGYRLFFAGDTAYTPTFRDLRKYGRIDVAFMPIGAYFPDEYQGTHCTPEQAWDMFMDTGATYIAPIHWDTFVLSREPVHEPLERLLAIAGRQVDRVIVREHGEVFRATDSQVMNGPNKTA